MIDYSNNLVLYCKSYRNDIDRIKILFDSINRYNTDKILFYISVPKNDILLFKNKLGSDINIIEDEQIYQSNNTPWISQQIIKSNFWKLGISKNYICIDSDSYFIKNFKIDDFIYKDDIPYTVIHEQKELFAWSVNKINELGFDPSVSYIEDRKKIMKVFDRVGKYYDCGPSPVIWSSKVWESLENNYINLNNLMFEDLINFSPSEFGWYCESLLAFNAIPIYPIEPLFKIFHYHIQYNEYKNMRYTEDMISKNYFGVVMQSNWNSPLIY